VLSLRVEREAPVPEIDDLARSSQDVWRDLAGAVCAWAESRDGERWMYIPRVGSYAFAAGSDVVRVAPQPSAPPEVVHSAFIRTVLPMALQFLGHEVMHASAVLASDGVVAFCAVSTTGKSTLAAAFNRRAYPLWADDAVAFETRHDEIVALALPFEAHLAPGGSGVRQPPLASAPLRAVCVLERRASDAGGPSPTVARLAPPDAFLALLTHAYCHSLDHVGRNRRMTDQYLEAASTLPVYRVTFEPDLERLPATVDALEREVGMSVPGIT
jgi:hypothetical protein